MVKGKASPCLICERVKACDLKAKIDMRSVQSTGWNFNRKVLRRIRPYFKRMMGSSKLTHCDARILSKRKIN